MSTKDFKPIVEGEAPVPADAKVIRWMPDDGCYIEWTNEHSELVSGVFRHVGWISAPQEVRAEVQRVIDRPPVVTYRSKEKRT